MLDAMNQALAWLQSVVFGAFDAVAGFVYGFLPDADTTIVAQMNSWAYNMNGADLDFNIYYFLDMPMVLVFIGVWVAVIVAGLTIMAVRFVLDIVHKIMDSIPVLG